MVCPVCSNGWWVCWRPHFPDTRQYLVMQRIVSWGLTNTMKTPLPFVPPYPENVLFSSWWLFQARTGARTNLMCADVWSCPEQHVVIKCPHKCRIDSWFCLKMYTADSIMPAILQKLEFVRKFTGLRAYHSYWFNMFFPCIQRGKIFGLGHSMWNGFIVDFLPAYCKSTFINF